MAKSDEIINACKQLRAIPANARECNEFVIAVAASFEITLTGIADQIIEEITGDGWTQHWTDGQAASAAAETGSLVLGGMTSEALGSAHGHVVIVVKGPLANAKYPTAYWGTENPLIRPFGALGKTVNFSFSFNDRDRVIYASRET
jgi:hypothetical protein